MKTVTAALVITFCMASCSKESVVTNPDQPQARMNPREGMVYVNGNQSGTNMILSYEQRPNGMLTYSNSTASGGSGSGTSLGSQGALALDEHHQWLYAVNAGDNSISSFAVAVDGSLTLTATVSSNGTMPVSLTVHQSYLYVVNSGSDNISGYMIGSGGTLTPIAGSVQPLCAAGAMPAQISFSPGGQYLYVTEKATNKISTYPVGAGGGAGVPVSTPSAGQTPFGYDFSGSYLIVSEAWGGAPGASTVSSYDGNNNASLVSGPVHGGQTAACWVEVTPDGKYAFVTNTGSNNISTYEVSNAGVVSLLMGPAATTGMGPIDITLSGNGMYLYNINGGSHSISQFRRVNNTKLMSIGTLTGLPPSATGIVAY